MSLKQFTVIRHRWTFIVWFFLCSTLSANASPATPSAQFAADSFLNNLSGVNLVDQHGKPFEPGSLQNQVILFNFIFTRCGSTCPIQTKSLAQVFTKLPADVRDRVRFVSISIDPENDTSAKLQAFSHAMGADLDGWSFLTGDPKQIEELTQRLHLFDESDSNEATRPQIHRTSLWLVDKQGRMLQRYKGDPPDNERLIRELTQVSRMANQS